MLIAQQDVTRYAGARVSAALDELQHVEIPEPARSRILYLLQAARGDFTEAAEDLGSDEQRPAPRTASASTGGASNVLLFRPRPL